MRSNASKLLVAALALALAPSLAFAAYNDVTLTTSAILSVGGYTLDVSGSSAVIQSITVNASNFSVTLASGSSITISSPTLQQLSSDVTSDVTSNICNGSASSISLSYSAGGTITNTITPSATLCSGSGSSGGSSPTSGGGNGAPVGLITSATGVAPVPVAAATSTASSSTTVVSTVSTPSTSASTAGSAPAYEFSKNLAYRDTDPDVLKLQQYLNAHGFVLAESGPGSPGEETDYFGSLTYTALVNFQNAHASEILAPVGLTQGTGYFGPATRAFVNSN
jgi:hypothetical protein